MTSLKIEDFNLKKMIGHGGYSKVYAAQYNNKMYAIKIAKKEKVLLRNNDVAEKKLLQIAEHPFIINLLACFQTPYHACYVLEYAPGGDLRNYVRRHGYLPEQNVAFYTAELAIAINFLHTKNIVHRDIKLGNVLIARDGHIKLTDLGLSKDMCEGPSNSYAGSVNYIAPEIIKGEFYSFEVDWWSFGICLYHLSYGRSPYFTWPTYKSKCLRDDILLKDIEFPMMISSEAITILKGLLNKNPDERLGKSSFLEITSQNYFAEIDWEKLESKAVNPPFVPQLQNESDFQYFDPDVLRTPRGLENLATANLTKINFKDFDYVSPKWQA